jgi:hypothetical protein
MTPEEGGATTGGTLMEIGVGTCLFLSLGLVIVVRKLDITSGLGIL